MNLRELELFGTLMRVGTTIETARLLGISQPGVSGQLKRLESRLGLTLFHRTGNRLEPTREANELFALAMPIFNTHSQIRSRLPSLRNHASRPVSISATPAIVEGYLGPVLTAAGYENWKKRIVLRVHSPEHDLRDGLADIGIQMALPPKAEFQSYSVGSIPLVAIMKREHELSRQASLSCAEIADHPLVCYDPDWSPMGALIRSTFEKQGITYDPHCLVPFCSNVCGLVRTCGGIGIVDAMTARDYDTKSLCVRPIGDLDDAAIIVFHRRHEPLRAQVQDLLMHLVREQA